MSAYVVFFGGYKATQTDMNVWLGSAKAQKPKIEFSAFPWPHSADSGAISAVTTFTKSGQYDSAVAAIQASSADLIYIVGHSSGCAIANAVDRGLKDHSHVVLVALDGFGPDRKQLARSSTQVWAAVCGGAKSKNYQPLKDLVGGKLKVYKATDCKTLWALHFSLVNAAATDSAVKSIATGYAQCRANLVWL
jgi:hypothetical protein